MYRMCTRVQSRPLPIPPDTRRASQRAPTGGAPIRSPKDLRRDVDSRALVGALHNFQSLLLAPIFVGGYCMQTRGALLGLLLVRPACSLSRSLRRGPGRVPRVCGARVSNLRSCRAPTSAAMSASGASASIHWFRKGLRLHDNRALLEACDGASALYPLFVLDSDPRSPEARAGSLR